jgi:hypothetical protein
MNWREALTARFDVTQARAEGSLAVTPCVIVAVYGLDLVAARPAIYVVKPVGVARVDKVVAIASVDRVVAFAGPDLVGPAATPQMVVAAVADEVVLPHIAPEVVCPATTLEVVGPASTLEVVVSVGPNKRFPAAVAGMALSQGLVGCQER